MQSRRPALAGIALVVALAATAIAPADTHPESFDRSVVALNILPPGQGGYQNAAGLALAQAAGIQPDHFTDQLDMYESLVERAPGASLTSLEGLFKDSTFGVAPGDVASSYSPGAGTTIVRDKSFNVPHVFGTTRAAVMFGAGYASGEDRMFMMDVLRHLSRGRVSELLGASPANLALDRAQRAVADYDEAELQAMGNRLLELDNAFGPGHPYHRLGDLAFADVTAFAEGVNAFIEDALLDPTRLPAEYAALQIVPKEWKTTDSIALATLIGGTFSVGGGGQLRNATFLNALAADPRYSEEDARAIFDDLRFANDPDAPVSTDTPFPFNTGLGAPDPDAVAMPDPALSAAAVSDDVPVAAQGPFGPIPLLQRKPASNALLINKSHSADGRPMAVFGPQVGYYSPEILMEIELHGPGVHARGAAFPGISIYALLGRGEDYAWSATTAIGDHIDIRAVELCEPGEPDGGHPTPDSKGYRRDGECHEIYERTDSWIAKPTAGGVPGNPSPESVHVSMTTQRVRLGDPQQPGLAGIGGLDIGPDWAIVAARGTVGGKPVAFARQRSSYGMEVDATLTFAAIHDPARIGDMDDLMHAFGDWFSFSFNWHLVNGDDIAFYTTGRYPTLKPGVDPDLPFWGDSAWDWTGFLPFEQHPHVVSPAKGYITNWNNKQAPQFRAPDDWWSYGPVGRMALLQDGVAAALAGDEKMSLLELVDVMGDAATQDVRGRYVLPAILDVIGTDGLSASEHEVVAILHAWASGGAHRRDADGNGTYEDAAAAAVMDALWEPALKAAFGNVLGDAYDDMPVIHDDAAGPGGSAYLEGWYGHLLKDLRNTLGLEALPFSRAYCGALTACRAAMRSALAAARAAVVANYGPDPADWGTTCLEDAPEGCRNVWEKDAIRFSAVGVQGQRAMHWQNRPTFQQVLEFKASTE